MNKPTLFTQKGCGMCKAIHMLLDKKNIDYDEIIITLENVEFYREKGIMSTPTLVVDGQLLSGKELKDWVASR